MKNLLYLLILGLLVGCSIDGIDSSKAHIFENTELTGTVYLKDGFLEAPTIIAPGATVYLYDTDTTGNYIQKTQTDQKGTFSFLYQPKSGESENIKLVAEFTDKSGLLFRKVMALPTFSSLATVGNDSLNLTARYPKGILKIKTTDDKMEVLNGVSVYLFVNKTQAETAQKSDPTTTAIRSYTSNERGIAFFSNLEANTYYVTGRKDAQYTGVSNVTVVAPQSTTNALQSYTTITGPATSTTVITASAPLLISLVGAATFSQLTVYVTSKTTPPISLTGADVYLLRTLVAVDLAGDLTSAVATKKTDGQGQATFSNVPAGTYFVAARGTFFSNGATVVKAGIASSPVSATLSTATPITFTSPTATGTPASVTVVIDGN